MGSAQNDLENEAWRLLTNNYAATTLQCKGTVSQVESMRRHHRGIQQQLQNTDDHLAKAQDAFDAMDDTETALKDAKESLRTLKTFGNLLKCCSGPLKPAGKVAYTALNTIDSAVDRVHSKVSSVRKKPAYKRTETRLVGARQRIQKLHNKIANVEETFDTNVLRQVLVADKLCPSLTSSRCPAVTQSLTEADRALENQRNAIVSTLPSSATFDIVIRYYEENKNTLKFAFITSVSNILRPVYDVLNKRHCVWIFWSKHCFRLKDLFDNWIYNLVSGMFDLLMIPFLLPVEQTVKKLIPTLPNIGINPNFLDGVSYDVVSQNVDMTADFGVQCASTDVDAVLLDYCFDAGMFKVQDMCYS